ncbi:MAG: hypothetical protein KJZ86_10795 [Caldilineaceae bacterium]|nr:hypothetical protein [Caldilineaceae bacterium]HRJ42733.1 hypothetical protein [Caldilineaceae bacterium]
MNRLIVELSPEVNAVLVSQARAQGKTTAEYACDLIESGIRRSTENSSSARTAADVVKDADAAYVVVSPAPIEAKPVPRPKTAREILEAAGMVRLLGDELTSLIGNDVPALDEVIDALSATDGPSLTEILDQQRGPKPWRTSS